MWGFSFDDLARRAHEEAAKLAEQASSSIGGQGLFNLDAMHPDGPSPLPSSSSRAAAAAAGGGFSTPVASSSSSHGRSDDAPRPFHTEPTKTTDWRGGVVDDDDYNRPTAAAAATIPDAAGGGQSSSSSPSRTMAVARKLRIEDDVAGDVDFDDFDSWGEGGGTTPPGEGRMGEMEQERKGEREAEEAGERERLAAEVEAAGSEKAVRLEDERLVAEAEAARVEADRMERERLAAEAEAVREEAERLERDGIAAEAEAVRQEAERLQRERERERERERFTAEAEAARVEAERLERERLAAEAQAARVESERLERERLEAEDEAARVEAVRRERLEADAQAAREEAERLEWERLEAEKEAAREVAERLERLEADAQAAREVDERLEWERLEAEEEAAREDAVRRERLEADAQAMREEAERLELERLEAEEEAAREEAVRRERLEADAQAAREEAERLERERLAAEAQALRKEAKRLEWEKLAAQEDKLAREEAERLQRERMAAEAEMAKEKAKRLDQERLVAEAQASREEAERMELERLAAEAEASKSIALEKERVAAEEAMVVERSEKEMLACERAKRAELDRLELERIERERILADDKVVEAEQSDKSGQHESPTNPTTQNDQTEAVHDGWGNDDMGGLYNDDELDDMYGDDDSDDDSGDEPVEASSNHESNKAEESIVEENANENYGENDQISHEIYVPIDEEPSMSENKPEQKGTDEESHSVEPAAAEIGFFDAAAAATSMFQTSKLFEASKTASMFSWGYNVSNKTPAEMVAPVAETALNTITESKSDYPLVSNGQVREGAEAVTTPQVKKADDQNSSGTHSLNQQNVPQHMLDKFMHQLERITESHQVEMNELQRMHAAEIDQLRSELLNEREMKKKASARDDVASQDKFLKQMRDLEKKFAGTIKDQESELRNLKQRNGEMESKVNTLNRDVSKLTEIVDERDEEICKLKQGYGNTMMQVEGQVKTRTEEIYKKDNEIYELKKSVSTLQAELDTTTDAYNTLKGRAKAVATELKDRRVEVRTLSSQNEELTSSNSSFDTQLSNLRALINQHELTIIYKDKDMEALNEKIKEMNKEIAKGRDRSLQDRSVGEKAIASYKRKAQEALAAANARLAAANQAREEAEGDAKNARSASDDAVERARVAETKRAEAELKASKASAQLESERMASSKDVNELKDLVESLKDTVSSLQAELEEATEKRVELVAELEQLTSDLSEQKEKNADLRDHMIITNTLCESLQREVGDLNEEVQRSSAVAFKRAKDNGEASTAESHIDSRSFSNLSVNGVAIDRQESDGTIIMLQQELQGANEAIAELKLALRTAILERVDNDYARDKGVSVRGAEALHDGVAGGGGGESNTGNESTPLFFAIEKQNELKTARDEINRLANMLGDAESSKQDAYDAMEDMRQKMEEANSRLLRYERLGMKSARPQVSHHSSYGPFRSNASGGHSSVLGDDARIQAGSDSAVNLEYLKNIMLRFLTATTLADRRKLVPVVATVLCLTPEEQAQAISSVERTAGLTGVASSFWENIESKAHNLTGI